MENIQKNGIEQPMTKKRTQKRPQQNEIALTGVGVEATTDKKLIELGDAFIDEKDTKTAAMKRLKELDAEIVNRMHILGIKCFKAGDKFWRIDAKERVKVTKVKEQSEPEQSPVEIGA